MPDAPHDSLHQVFRDDAILIIDVETAIALAEYTEAGLQKAPALTLWKAFMSTSTKPFITALGAEHEARGVAIGEAIGEAKSVLAVLEDRGVTVSDEARARITGCTDAEQLMAWLRLSLRITTIDELFDRS